MYDHDPYITPKEARQGFLRWLPTSVLIGVISLAVLVGLGFGLTFLGQSFGWWMQSRQVNQQNQMYQNSYGTQQSDIDQMESDIGNIATPGLLPAQASADARDACKWAARITIIPPGDRGWVSANCLAGGLTPASIYNQ